LNGLENIVDASMNAEFEHVPSDDEIQRALFEMHPTNTPGPNGFHALVYQKL